MIGFRLVLDGRARHWCAHWYDTEKRGLPGDLSVILWTGGDAVHWGFSIECGAMRGKDQQSDNFFSYIGLGTRIPADQPLRPIRKVVDEALPELPSALSKLYAGEGWPSTRNNANRRSAIDVRTTRHPVMSKYLVDIWSEDVIRIPFHGLGGPNNGNSRLKWRFFSILLSATFRGGRMEVSRPCSPPTS